MPPASVADGCNPTSDIEWYQNPLLPKAAVCLESTSSELWISTTGHYQSLILYNNNGSVFNIDGINSLLIGGSSSWTTTTTNHHQPTIVNKRRFTHQGKWMIVDVPFEAPLRPAGSATCLFQTRRGSLSPVTVVTAGENLLMMVVNWWFLQMGDPQNAWFRLL